MLVFRNLVIENFGPFKGEQKIEFPEDEGISIVFGENMRGKTSLLSAVRYALFGKIIGRGSREMPIYETANWESVSEGIYGFKVVLSFEQDGDSFVLTRQCESRNPDQKPTSDADYSENFFLSRNGTILGPEDRDSILNGIMPKQVSRFFLFDGELL